MLITFLAGGRWDNRMAEEEAGGPQQYCLKWNNYQVVLLLVGSPIQICQESLSSTFSDLLASDSFVDVTLSCEDDKVIVLM